MGKTAVRCFEVIEVSDLAEAAALLRQHGAAAHPLAGGGDLFPLLRQGVVGAGSDGRRVLVDLTSIPGLDRISYEQGNGLTIGAMATLADIQAHRAVRDRYRGLAEAAAEVGSPEVRRAATLGGNLCQRPRCAYFRQREVVCLKKGGARCWAVEGDHQYYHAILEGGPCFAVHPSDLAPALIAADATVRLGGGAGPREMPLEDFLVTPAADPTRETLLSPGELLAEVWVPDPPPGSRSAFVKARMDPSWDFGLASAAVSLVIRDDVVRDARVVLGGVSPRPYRARAAEELLRHGAIDPELVEAAAKAALTDAQPMRRNAYKVDLARALVRRAIGKATGGHFGPAGRGVRGTARPACCHAPAGPVRCRGCPEALRPRRRGEGPRL